MDIVNETPFVVGTVLWENLQGQPKMTVVVKATFQIKAGGSSLFDEQVPILTTDEHYGEDPSAPVKFESDTAPFKPCADVVLVGRAHAPGGQPVTKLDTTIRVGRLQKTIRVFGDRKWRFPSKLTLIPVISTPEPFVTMDVVYERAFGGIDESAGEYCEANLNGKGFIGEKSKKSINGKPLPNLEDPRNLIRSWKSRPKPVGYGFYGRGWMPRLRFAGTYDETYQKERAPAFPHDFDYSFFNSAHPDLQFRGYLRGDERVELRNLSSEPTLRFRLPGRHPKILVSRWVLPPDKWVEQEAGERRDVDLGEAPTTEQPVEAVLDTLVFVPDKDMFYEVFRGVCSLTTLDDLEVAQIKVVE